MTAKKPTGYNGKVGLTWAQIVWGLGMLATLLAQWYRMESRMTQLEATLALQPSPIALEQRMGNLETKIKLVETRVDIIDGHRVPR